MIFEWVYNISRSFATNIEIGFVKLRNHSYLSTNNNIAHSALFGQNRRYVEYWRPASVFLQVQNIYIKLLTFVYNLKQSKSSTNGVNHELWIFHFAIFLYDKPNTELKFSFTKILILSRRSLAINLDTLWFLRMAQS